MCIMIEYNVEWMQWFGSRSLAYSREKASHIGFLCWHFYFTMKPRLQWPHNIKGMDVCKEKYTLKQNILPSILEQYLNNCRKTFYIWDKH